METEAAGGADGPEMHEGQGASWSTAGQTRLPSDDRAQDETDIDRVLVRPVRSHAAGTAGFLAGWPLRITLATVVRHLPVLEECGLVRTEKTGRRRVYHINGAGLAVLEKRVDRSKWDRRLDRLGGLLGGTGETG